MDETVNQLFNTIFKRLDELERKINSIPRVRMASQGQIDYIKGLGGKIWSGITFAEASDLIDKLKKGKETPTEMQTETQTETPESPTEEQLKELNDEESSIL